MFHARRSPQCSTCVFYVLVDHTRIWTLDTPTNEYSHTFSTHLPFLPHLLVRIGTTALIATPDTWTLYYLPPSFVGSPVHSVMYVASTITMESCHGIREVSFGWVPRRRIRQKVAYPADPTIGR